MFLAGFKGDHQTLCESLGYAPQGERSPCLGGLACLPVEWCDYCAPFCISRLSLCAPLCIECYVGSYVKVKNLGSLVNSEEIIISCGNKCGGVDEWLEVKIDKLIR